jgi:hypothetical protein
LVNLQYFPTLTVLTMTSQSTPLRFGGVDLKTNITGHFLKSLKWQGCIRKGITTF